MADVRRHIMKITDYRQCLEHLEAAERCMDERTDGLHLARLSLVIERLREEKDLSGAFVSPGIFQAK
jgi:hypothetical protein